MMINKMWKCALIAGLVLGAGAMPAFAQTMGKDSGTGNVFPLVYDTEGGAHWLLDGYYGPFKPPIPPQELCCFPGVNDEGRVAGPRIRSNARPQ
jgi:hypothetical protein